jgi:hypothetical protein
MQRVIFNGAVYRLAGKDPSDTLPPKAMVSAAKSFLLHYVDMNIAAQHDPYLDDEVVDDQVDAAHTNWLDWTGKAFNQALQELGLIDEL